MMFSASLSVRLLISCVVPGRWMLEPNMWIEREASRVLGSGLRAGSRLEL